jgi:hypothetical protein
VSDIDTAAADSLKVLDLKRPIREADMDGYSPNVCFVPIADIGQCRVDVSFYIQKQTSQPKKKRDRHNGRSPQSPALAFGNDRRRRGLTLAVVRSGLRGGRDAEERQRRCRQ